MAPCGDGEDRIRTTVLHAECYTLQLSTRDPYQDLSQLYHSSRYRAASIARARILLRGPVEP